MLRIAILTSHYGDFGNLRRCIHSVHKDAQYCKSELEICHHVVVDGFASESRQYLSSFENEIQVSGASIEYNSENLGKSRRLNQLLQDTDSDVVMFLDSDDIFLPGKIQRQIEVLEVSQEFLVGTGYYPYFRPWQFSDPVIPPANSDQIATQFIFYPHMLFSTMAIFRERMQLLGRYITFDEDLKGGIDYDFYSRLITDVSFTNIQLPLVGYQISPKGITRGKQTRAIQLRTHLRVVRNLLSPKCLLNTLSDSELSLCLFSDIVDPDLRDAVDSFSEIYGSSSAYIFDLIEKLNSCEPAAIVNLPVLLGSHKINVSEIVARMRANLYSRLRRE